MAIVWLAEDNLSEKKGRERSQGRVLEMNCAQPRIRFRLRGAATTVFTVLFQALLPE
jgi:hypothetical protein